jgi:hypothetical protein
LDWAFSTITGPSTARSANAITPRLVSEGEANLLAVPKR